MLAHSVQELLDSLEDQEYAVVRAGRVLVVKYLRDGQSVVVTRVLSPTELRVLDRFPEIERNPERVFDALAAALTAEGEAGRPNVRIQNVRISPLERLVHELSPPLDVPTPAEVLQARRNAEARAQLLAEFGALTSAEVADLLGSEAKNRNSLAHRLKKEGRLFAVSYKGTAWYPGFQFRGGTVLPQLADVLSELAGAGLGDWETALWFTARNGWLDDRRPVDLLLDETGRVVDAASREGTDLDG